jgi:hypothetical protein
MTALDPLLGLPDDTEAADLLVLRKLQTHLRHLTQPITECNNERPFCALKRANSSSACRIRAGLTVANAGWRPREGSL